MTDGIRHTRLTEEELAAVKIYDCVCHTKNGQHAQTCKIWNFRRNEQMPSWETGIERHFREQEESTSV